MLLEGSEDPILIDIVHRLTQVDSEEEMTSCFEELNRLGEVRAAEWRKYLAKERRDKDLPQRVGASELQDAAAEWGMAMPGDEEGEVE